MLLQYGLATIDHGLSLLNPEYEKRYLRGSPVSLETRLVAITTFLHIPEILNRRGQAKKLLQETLNSPLFPTAPTLLQGRAYLRAGVLAMYEKNQQLQKEYLENALARLPEGTFSDYANELLSKLNTSILENH